LILREIQIGGGYQGISASFFARLFTTRIPMVVDIGFNDIVIPEPQTFFYPTLLEMPVPKIMGYTAETVIAEKLEAVVKLGLVNTRLKDFYDLWILCRGNDLNAELLELAIREIFEHRGTQLEFPMAFTKAFYESPETILRWRSFLNMLGKEPIPLKDVIAEIVNFMKPVFAKAAVNS
jgi:hypothetical protein